MKRSRTRFWLIAAALFVFACSPVLAPQVVSTLDPSSLNTAIAGTAAAAAAGTASQGLQPVIPAAPGGPVLDANGVNTAIALTAAAAGTQTAALIPPTLTPSYTPFPTWTASIVPSPTVTFIFRLPTFTRTPRPAPTGTPDDGGGGGGGNGKNYSCRLLSVSPEPNTVMNRGQSFQAVWRVRNIDDDWLGTSTDLVFVEGTRFANQGRYDLGGRVNGGQDAVLPKVNMNAPTNAGKYTSIWYLQIGKEYFCRLPVTIEVR